MITRQRLIEQTQRNVGLQRQTQRSDGFPMARIRHRSSFRRKVAKRPAWTSAPAGPRTFVTDVPINFIPSVDRFWIPV
jgi:hypothetical protein